MARLPDPQNIQGHRVSYSSEKKGTAIRIEIKEGEGQMTELKRCPFCGGEAGIIKYMDGTYCVECKNDNCNMIAMTVLADTEARAVEIWNTRPNPWHTGTPTEDGWFLVCIKAEDGLHYDTDFNNGDCWVYGIVDTSKILAWQKIEPYKENEDGRTD